ncbi:MAG TPA: NADH-quinone oxidoreductase subunit NuoN [Acidiferrobacterales bacterium]|nr:NADH-quinone oxidoreductase subunit NuoN [Acidiferrobacterales bacterium]
MNFVAPNIAPAIPEIFVFSMACLILIVDLYIPDRRQVVSYVLAQVTLVGAILLTLWRHEPAAALSFNNMFIADGLADLLKIAVYLITLVVFVYSRDYIRDRGMYRGEYFVLGLFGVVGMMVMASASHFLTLYLGLELLSLSLYAMVAFQRDSSHATEAAMKYFVLGALSSGLLLYGMSMLYGVTGSLEMAKVAQAIGGMRENNIVLIFGLVFVIAGIAFKLGAAPFHMWIPDVYHGAPTSVTLYIAAAPKLAAFAMFMRLLIGGLHALSPVWQEMLIIMAILSMVVGNVIAIAQTNLKRMLAYSTISHMGFLLLGILSATPNGYSSALFYALIYALMNLGAFGMIILLSRAGFEAERLDDMKGLNQRNPWYALLMLLLMFSLAGIPPTAGFYAKLVVIQALIDSHLLWLAVLAVLLAVIGAYYYLRVVKLMYFDSPQDQAPIQVGVDLKLLISANGLAMVLMTPWIGSLMALCQTAIKNTF